MAPRKPTPTTPQAAQLSPEQMRASVPKLERRINELKAFDIAQVRSGDDLDRLEALRTRIEDTLVDIYGPESLDYQRYAISNLDDTPFSMYNDPPPPGQRHASIKAAVSRALTTLESALSMMNERMGDSGEDAGSRSIRAYGDLDLHPEIARAATKLYKDGHYANAVEAAVKRLNALVRMRSDLEVDGTTLMERAFSPSNPILRFNTLTDQSDKDEQKGFMMMFSGAVSGLRNPRAHGFINDDPERALEFIAFVSLLAKLLEGADRADS
jgi:uncharacterized protein (TIGR02391 family)